MDEIEGDRENERERENEYERERIWTREREREPVGNLSKKIKPSPCNGKEVGSLKS